MGFVEPIPQDPCYHRFADRRTIAGVPNALDVLSNAPFVIVGAAALAALLRRRVRFVESHERWAWITAFLGCGLTGFSSAWYHLDPTTPTLFWDRLPMTILFMGILSAMITERISTKLGVGSLIPLVVIGISSVLWWHFGEEAGHGDLRPYALVQYLPAVLIPLMIWWFPGRYDRSADLFVALGWYAVAKACELGDHQVFSLGEVVSGHTLKHLFAALSTWWLYRMLRLRRRVS